MKWSLALLGLLSCSVAADSGYHLSQSDFGGTGLMQMPTGRMDQEGAFHLSGFFNDEYYRYSVSVQLFPWLESTLRYTDVRTQLYSGDASFSNDNTYKDKSIDFKVRLLEESYWLPETSLGFRDIGGTGLFDGEFLAANKRYGNWDFTLGLAWGYLGKSGNISNPACKLSDSYCERPGGYGGRGGQVDFNRFFKGDAAIYGGLEYQTPWQPLSLKLEYDGNDYRDDFAGELEQKSKFNLGAVYDLGGWGDLHLSYQRGNTLVLGFSVGAYFNEMPSIWQDQPKPKLTSKPARTAKDWQNLAYQLESNAGYRAPRVYQSEDTLTLVAEQMKYRNRNEALERAATLMASAANSEINTFEVIETEKHLPLTRTQINRQEFTQHAQAIALNTQFEQSLSRTEPMKPAGELKFKANDRWHHSFSPVLSQSVGGPENNYLYSIGIKGSGGFWLSKHLQLESGITLNLINNYDEFNFVVPPDGTDQLRVRTLVRDYMEQRIRLNNLQLTWAEGLSQNLYGQLYAGYLETMFAGVGAELLYRPLDQNWAIGADINLVSQRDPENPFGVFSQENQYSQRDNKAYRVAHRQQTGHLTFYYRPNWNSLKNTLVKVSAGRYLAGDHGMTLDFSKQFKSGVIVGAYASKTNMSTEEFGEGSFTKGFYLSIPFDILTIKPSTSRAEIGWQPITRDGGQKLKLSSSLYEKTDARNPWYTREKAL